MFETPSRGGWLRRAPCGQRKQDEEGEDQEGNAPSGTRNLEGVHWLTYQQSGGKSADFMYDGRFVAQCRPRRRRHARSHVGESGRCHRLRRSCHSTNTTHRLTIQCHPRKVSDTSHRHFTGQVLRVSTSNHGSLFGLNNHVTSRRCDEICVTFAPTPSGGFVSILQCFETLKRNWQY